jgi:hypothetical protein
MVHFENAAPCLLHHKNQGSECVIYHLLLRGWRYREGDKQATKEFIRNDESLIIAQLFEMQFALLIGNSQSRMMDKWER